MAVDLSFYKSYISEEIRDEGRAQGLEQGLEQGHVQRAAEDVLLVLGQRGLEVSEEVRGRITECGDAELLRAWLVRAVVVSEAEEIFEGE
ncbi:hypothetical protein [Streptomyces prasinus]|uniref:hypothetical protein n=1 Tax=Streptomyces prasinus TaxID=67345 RepID=UPI0006EB5C8F